MDREELADFLRRRRARLVPADVGLVDGARRRTEGLRREEVAALAGMSADYYTRLEQHRGSNPSAPILVSLARALRLTDDERDHLFHLAGQVPPVRYGGGQHVSPGLLYLLDHLPDTPAFVVSDLGDALVQNAMSRLISGDYSTAVGLERNLTWGFFVRPGSRISLPHEDWERHARTHVADLRATAARREGDPDVTVLVERLRVASPEFASLWAEHEVAVRRIVHPEVGVLDLLCERLTGAVGGQILVVLHPRPGTDCRDKLDLLRVLGSQTLMS